ncbi:MAG: molybdopterin-dependent oxidoreductase [Coleofasciculaceae cyanobacterium SM2_1_6]|nr:molybdopterin-dependent oxidoreductase [Coleofasciculaceae cyanobacterium SM2_1_6]
MFPYSDYPELPDKYSDAFWAFYVTDMIVGNEPGAIKVDIKPFDVGSKLFDRPALDALPQVTIEEPVDYKFGWPVGKVKLTGVRLRDIIAAADIELSSQGRVFIKGKASLSSEPQEPVQLPIQEVLNCDIILATRWGKEAVPIPSSMGGPITLAFANSCKNGVILSPKNSQHWATLVERVEVN